MISRASSIVSAVLMAIVCTCATRVFAGPPLICHPIEIGKAATLPWVDLNYQKADSSYNLQNLAKDTLAVLDAKPAVLVRMETLRRATLYARQDPQVAKELLTRLRARATEAPANAAGALAWFDFGYLTEAYKQWLGKNEPNPATGRSCAKSSPHFMARSWLRKRPSKTACAWSCAPLKIAIATTCACWLRGPPPPHRQPSPFSLPKKLSPRVCSLLEARICTSIAGACCARPSPAWDCAAAVPRTLPRAMCRQSTKQH
jgi:hypothetical protein